MRLGNALCFTDIHFGAKSDSEKHNIDCMRFIDWVIDNSHDTDSIVFMGDWFDNQSRLRVDTLNYAITAIDKLKELNKQFYWLVGNHDMFFKQSREVTSLSFLKNDPNINLIDKPVMIEDNMLCPYLIGDEYAYVIENPCKFIFGHFSIPTFLVNEMVEYHGTSGIEIESFTKCKAVFSGHFHKRQIKVNSNGVYVIYIGNCFPHTFNDVGDINRGIMKIDTTKDMKFDFFDWGDAPNYQRTTVSELVDTIDRKELTKIYNKYSVIECKDDIGLDAEELLELKISISDQFREIRMIPKIEDSSISQETSLMEKETIDDMVIHHLSQMDTTSGKYDKKLLIEIYKDIPIK